MFHILQVSKERVCKESKMKNMHKCNVNSRATSVTRREREGE